MEMWMWRKITGTRWVEHKTNDEVLDEVNKRRAIMNAIMERKIKLIGLYLNLILY